jgi:hypothetical protein
MSLPRLFLASTGRLIWVGIRGLWPVSRSPAGEVRFTPLRPLIHLVFFVPFALLQCIHWIGLVLDEILFRGYRQVEVKAPLFVLGVPRSGTTHLHRVLAQDPQFTTFSTWECLFAPSVTERRVWLALGRLDARIGRPLGRLLDWIEGRAFSGIASVHSMRLADPEEDYFTLLPVLATFILVLPFPADHYLWRMGSFDRDMPEAERLRLLAFYRGCLQRHLYVHGPGKRLLSKNAAFAPLANGLRQTFPDARFLVCLRPPRETLASQLSSVEPGVRFFRVTELVPDFRERLARQIGFYYENLDRTLGSIDADRCAWVTLDDLRNRLGEAIPAAYERLGLGLAPEFLAHLAAAASGSRTYRSQHSYTAEQFGPTTDDLAGALSECYRRMTARSVLNAPPDSRSGDAPRARGHGQGRSGQDTSARGEPVMPC